LHFGNTESVTDPPRRDAALQGGGHPRPDPPWPAIPLQSQALSAPTLASVQVGREPGAVEARVDAIVVVVEVATRHPLRLGDVEPTIDEPTRQRLCRKTFIDGDPQD